uniref:Cytochrome P450 n=1 Tax=Megaselia scalaris TaxID=36166 RepID=T1GP68_MEGSC
MFFRFGGKAGNFVCNEGLVFLRAVPMLHWQNIIQLITSNTNLGAVPISVGGGGLFTKEASKFLFSTIGYTMDERKTSGTIRNDLIDVLLTLKKENYPHDLIVAQAAVFFTAGYEGPSSIMSFALYELCQNQEIQKKLRKEIKETLIKSDGPLTYDLVQSMEYLGMVVQEVIRMYPRMFLKNPKDTYKLDNKLIISHLTHVYIPIYAIHRDPQYFPEPNTFNPERFIPENNPSMAYMPFGLGSHNCIGKRLGLLQLKIGLIHVLSNHYLIPNEKTQKEMVVDVVMVAKGGIYCDVYSHLTPVYIPIYAIHRDPQYFPEPNTFNPERFLPGNNPSMAYLPFGMGSHNCIGKRFGLLQLKIGIIHFLSNHYLIPNEKTQKEMVVDSEISRCFAPSKVREHTYV